MIWHALAVSLFAGVGALFLKFGSRKFSLKSPFNLNLLIGFVLYVFATVFFVFGVRSSPLSVFYSVTALLYVVSSLCGFIFLKERVTPRKIFGLLFIIAGVVLVSLR